MRYGLVCVFTLLVALNGRADVVFKTVEYKQGDTVLEGLSVYDDAMEQFFAELFNKVV